MERQMPKPKIIINKYIPFGRYIAINLFGIIFARKELSDTVIRHEQIHTLLMRELLYIGFYILYIFEWGIRLLGKDAYRSISFEREAYDNQKDIDYLLSRKHFSWIKYIKK